MANGFTVNAHRFDPYKNFKFVLFWDGRQVLGVSKVGALKRTTEVVSHRSGGDNSIDYKSPGRTKYEALSLERGITHDHEFEVWANKVHSFAGGPSMDLVGYKKELTLEVRNERGQPALRYFLHDCWPSSYTSVPDLNSNENAVAIESLELQIGGWERDLDLGEPDEAA